MPQRAKPITKCTMDGCDRPKRSTGSPWCHMHFNRVRRHGDPGGPLSTVMSKVGVCSVPGCGRHISARRLCAAHYSRQKRHGDVMEGLAIKPQGEGTITLQGYRSIYRPEHPNATRFGSILEHRYVMSEMLGRPLVRGETVHHKNGDRQDNRPENLEVWGSRHGPGQRTADLVADAVAVLRLYAPELLVEG